MVVSYDERVDRGGNRYKQIINVEEFSSHKEALDYVENQRPSNHRIAGFNPFISPVPLEAVQNYRLVYSSKSSVYNADARMIPEVKNL